MYYCAKAQYEFAGIVQKANQQIHQQIQKSNIHAGFQGVFLRFYDLLCILSQKDIESIVSVTCSTRRVTHMAIYVLVKVSDPLENPANYKILRKSLIYMGFKFAGFFRQQIPSKFM